MRHFFSLWGILIVWASPLFAENSQALGQWKIRDAFQESMIRPESLPSFYKSYGLDGLSEQILAKPDLDTSEVPSFASVDSLLWKFHHQVSARPFHIFSSLHTLKLALQETSRRPIDAMRSIGMSLQHFAFPVALCIFLFCIFQLFSWVNPIRKDIAKGLGARAHALPLFFLIVILVLTYITHQVGLGLLSLVFLAAIYSRRNTFLKFIGWTIALGLCLQDFGSSFLLQLRQEVPREALREGRNRIEYPMQDLMNLSLPEQASWAFWNQSPSLALQILEKAPSSLEKEVLSTIIQVNPRNFSESIHALEALRRKYGEHKDLLFNLSQLYLESQDLVRAEELRKKVPEDYLKHSFDRITRTEKTLFPISPETDWTALLRKSLQASSTKFYPPESQQVDQWIKYFVYLLTFLLPLFLMGSVSFWRKRVSGLCVLTGEATARLSEPHSKLANQVQQKSDELDPQARQRYLQYHRYYEQAKTERIRRWTKILPGTPWLVDESFVSGIFVSCVFYFLVWSGISQGLRVRIHELSGFTPLQQFFETGWSLPCLVAAAVIYILCIIKMRRRFI